MSVLGESMFPPSNRRRCYKGRPSYVEPSDLFIPREDSEDGNNCFEIGDEFSSFDEDQRDEEEETFIDLSAFMKENPLLTEPEAEVHVDADLDMSHSKFRVTSSKLDTTEVVVDKTPQSENSIVKTTATSSTSLGEVNCVASDFNKLHVSTETDHVPATELASEKENFNCVSYDSQCHVEVSTRPQNENADVCKELTINEINRTSLEKFGKYAVVKCEKLDVEKFIKTNQNIKLGSLPISTFSSFQRIQDVCAKDSLCNKKVIRQKTIFKRPTPFGELSMKSEKIVLNSSNLFHNSFRSVSKPVIKTNSWKPETSGTLSSSQSKFFTNLNKTKRTSTPKLKKALGGDLQTQNRQVPLITSVNKLIGKPKYQIISQNNFINNKDNINMCNILNPIVLDTVPHTSEYTVIEPYVGDDCNSFVENILSSNSAQVESHNTLNATTKNSKDMRIIKSLSEICISSKWKSKIENDCTSTTTNNIKKTSEKKASPPKSNFIIHESKDCVETEEDTFEDLNTNYAEAAALKAKNLVFEAINSSFSLARRKKKSKDMKKDPTLGSAFTESGLLGCRAYNTTLNDILFGCESLDDDYVEVKEEIIDNDDGDIDVKPNLLQPTSKAALKAKVLPKVKTKQKVTAAHKGVNYLNKTKQFQKLKKFKQMSIKKEPPELLDSALSASESHNHVKKDTTASSTNEHKPKVKRSLNVKGSITTKKLSKLKPTVKPAKAKVFHSKKKVVSTVGDTTLAVVEPTIVSNELNSTMSSSHKKHASKKPDGKKPLPQKNALETSSSIKAKATTHQVETENNVSSEDETLSSREKLILDVQKISGHCFEKTKSSKEKPFRFKTLKKGTPRNPKNTGKRGIRSSTFEKIKNKHKSKKQLKRKNLILRPKKKKPLSTKFKIIRKYPTRNSVHKDVDILNTEQINESLHSTFRSEDNMKKENSSKENMEPVEDKNSTHTSEIVGSSVVEQENSIEHETLQISSNPSKISVGKNIEISDIKVTIEDDASRVSKTSERADNIVPKDENMGDIQNSLNGVEKTIDDDEKILPECSEKVIHKKGKKSSSESRKHLDKSSPIEDGNRNLKEETNHELKNDNQRNPDVDDANTSFDNLVIDENSFTDSTGSCIIDAPVTSSAIENNNSVEIPKDKEDSLSIETKDFMCLNSDHSGSVANTGSAIVLQDVGKIKEGPHLSSGTSAKHKEKQKSNKKCPKIKISVSRKPDDENSNDASDELKRWYIAERKMSTDSILSSENSTATHVSELLEEVISSSSCVASKDSSEESVKPENHDLINNDKEANDISSVVIKQEPLESSDKIVEDEKESPASTGAGKKFTIKKEDTKAKKSPMVDDKAITSFTPSKHKVIKKADSSTKTPTNDNQRSAKKSKGKDYSSEAVTLPFSMGWMRELVHRATESKDGRRNSDVYYFAPEGVKLRSMPEISNHLARTNETTLTLANFTYKKEIIYREPFEIERNAKQASTFIQANSRKIKKEPVENQNLKRKVDSDELQKTPKMGKSEPTNLKKEKDETPKSSKKTSKVHKSSPTVAENKTVDTSSSSSGSKSASRPSRTIIKKIPFDNSAEERIVVRNSRANSQKPVNNSSAVSTVNKDSVPPITLRIPKPNTCEIVKRSFPDGENNSNKSAEKRPRLTLAVKQITIKHPLPMPCTFRCHSARYQFPSVECAICLCLFHTSCVPMAARRIGFKYACSPCTAAKLEQCELLRQSEESQIQSVAEDFYTDPEFPTAMEISLLTPEVVLTFQAATNLGIITTPRLPSLPPLPDLKKAPERKNVPFITTVQSANCILKLPPLKPAPSVKQTLSSLPNANQSISAQATILQNASLINAYPIKHSPMPSIVMPPDKSCKIFPLSQRHLSVPTITKHLPKAMPPLHAMFSDTKRFANVSPSTNVHFVKDDPKACLIDSKVKDRAHCSPLLKHKLKRDNSVESITDVIDKKIASYSKLYQENKSEKLKSQSSDYKFMQPLPIREESSSLSVPAERSFGVKSSPHVNHTKSKPMPTEECLNVLFKRLDICDLIRVSQVCSMWRKVASQEVLWETVSFQGLLITDWERCSAALEKFKTKTLDVSGIVLGAPYDNPWQGFLRHTKFLQNVEHLIFGKAPPNVITTVASSMTQLCKLECHMLTACYEEAEMSSKVCIFNLSSLRHLENLELLAIRSPGSVFLSQATTDLLLPFPHLHSLSLTSFKFKTIIAGHMNNLCKLTQLTSLELGDCNYFTSEIYENIGKLTNLKNLRLENGGSTENDALSHALSNLKNLQTLELMNFPIPASLSDALQKIEPMHLNLWPYTWESPETNYNAFEAVSKAKYLKTLCWGVISETDDIPNFISLRNPNDSNDSTEVITSEELFNKLVLILPSTYIEFKCVLKQLWAEFCTVRK